MCGKSVWFLTILGAACAGLLILIKPGTAQAEGNCPPGHVPTIDPGTGRQTGCMPTGNGGGSSDGGFQPGPGTRPMRPLVPVKNFYAGAWHDESAGAWIASGWRTAGDAEKAAVAACNRVMGKDCKVGFSSYNTTVAVARGARGQLYSYVDVSSNKAKQGVLDFCRAERDFCEVISVNRFSSPGKAEMYMTFPEDPKLIGPTGNPRKVYGAVAFIDSKRLSNNPWVGDLWVASGRSSAKSAMADAQATCDQDMPTPCVVVMVGSDVSVAIVMDDTGAVTMMSSVTSRMAEKRAMDVCKSDKGRKCKLVRVVDLTKAANARIAIPSPR